MPVVDRSVNKERLEQLLDEQTESEQLEFKSECDLNRAHDLVMVVAETAAMQMNPEGGYIVLGAEDDGAPVGLSGPQVRLLDEATVRDKFGKYLPEPFDLLVAVHEIEGKNVALLWIGPSRDCFTVFTSDGDYSETVATPDGDQVKARKRFKAGDVFARHGTKSEAWTQADVEKVKARIRDQEREKWAEQIRHDLPNLGVAREAVELAEGPAAYLTWQLDGAAFVATIIEQLRRNDEIPLILLLDRMTQDASDLIMRANGDEELGVLLDRLTCLIATAIRLQRPDLIERGLEKLFAIYERGLDEYGVAQSNLGSVSAQHLWLMVVERVMGLGALAVRRDQWIAVRTLVLQRGDQAGYDWGYYRNWIRHGLTMASRAGLFVDSQSRSAEQSLLSLASNDIDRLDCLRPDLADGDEAILTSLCRFDFLAALVAIDDAGSLDTSSFYTSFARFYNTRTEPIVVRLLGDEEMRRVIFPRSDRELADTLRELDRLARQEGFRFSGWHGFENREILEFLALNPPSET